MEQLGSHWKAFHKIGYFTNFGISAEQIKAPNPTTITGTLHAALCKFMIISRSILLRIRNISDKVCRENQNTHFYVQWLFFPENRAVYKIIWKNTVQPDRPQITIRNVRFACWIRKVTDTHPEHVLLIALPWQQWLRERTSMLHLYVHCLSRSFTSREPRIKAV